MFIGGETKTPAMPETPCVAECCHQKPMKFEKMTRREVGGVLVLGAMAFLSGCACRPVGEQISGRPYLFMPRSGSCPPALNPPVPNRCTSALQEYPDGIHELSGGPLYYNPENLNWEQAPPFGRW